MCNNKLYWDNFYLHFDEIKESAFARFCSQYLKKNTNMIELGCGNGRDACFLSKYVDKFIAVDQSICAINLLKQKNLPLNLSLLNADFTNLGDIGSFDAIYSRFTLHAIPADAQKRLFDWCNTHLDNGGIFFIEARGIQNELYGRGVKGEDRDSFIYNNHYRRFLRLNELKDFFVKNGYEVLFEAEQKGFAPYKDENQIFLRIIVKKIKKSN